MDPLNKTSVSCRQEELSQIIHFDGYRVLLPIDNILELSHILQVSVDWIKLFSRYGWIDERGDEISASLDLLIVIWDVDVSVDLQFHL